jgi:transposase InsO family protein
MIAFIKDHREVCGVEPICRILQIAPSTFYAHLAVRPNPSLASDRTKRDAELRPEMKKVWKDNRSVYGARKLWHAMKREKFDVARCTVKRLMRDIGIEGVRRGKKIKTTRPDKALPSPLDRVNRQFRATMSNQLWVSDFTYVSTTARQHMLACVREVAGLCLRGFCDRHFCQQNCRLAGLKVTANTVCLGCA